MVVSKITIQHADNILARDSYIIAYTDTVTGISGSIGVDNGDLNLSSFDWCPYFVTNAVYSNALFSASKDGSGNSFSFQALNPNIVFTDYYGIRQGAFGVPIIITTGFTKTIATVTVPDVAPIPAGLPIINRTPIEGANKIKFCNSPLFLRHTISGLETSITVSLFIWNGIIKKPLSLANITLKKSKVSNSDNYISIEISDLIHPYINPNFAYNRAAKPAITTQGVFLQAVIETNLGVKTFTNTNFVTLGYRWNYEQNIIGDNGVQNYGASGFIVPVEKWYNPKIHNYFFQDFDFTKTVDNATTENIIRYNAITPTKLRCTQDPSLIVFINKLGLWETFTPHGKFTASSKVTRQDTNVSHRDPSQVDNSFIHSRVNNALDVKQSYVINTGSLEENMTSIIEELIYSPKVYLIRFKGDFELVTTVGITIDSTLVTIDSTLITIDSQTITAEYLGSFKTHQQIPVVITDEDYTRKTRLNDKIAIDYNLKFEETNSKINSIR